MTNALSIKNLRKEYQEFTLKDVSFDLPKGCIMGLVGENGAGKTTIIKALLNLIQKDGGSADILGMDSVAQEKEIREQIGVVFDNQNFHDAFTPHQVSKIMSKIYQHWDEDQYHRYLQQFDLPEKKRLKEYSRGMKAKFSIITALSHHPRLLILDEATSGLDPVMRNEILGIFMEFIQDEENSVLLSSHITSDLDKIADYITFIHDGQVVFSEQKDTLTESMGIIKGSREDILTLPKELVIRYQDHSFSCEALIKDRNYVKNEYPQAVIDAAGIEEIMLFYVKGVSL